MRIDKEKALSNVSHFELKQAKRVIPRLERGINFWSKLGHDFLLTNEKYYKNSIIVEALEEKGFSVDSIMDMSCNLYMVVKWENVSIETKHE